jgi:hypothetical protein
MQTSPWHPRPQQQQAQQQHEQAPTDAANVPPQLPLPPHAAAQNQPDRSHSGSMQWE